MPNLCPIEIEISVEEPREHTLSPRDVWNECQHLRCPVFFNRGIRTRYTEPFTLHSLQLSAFVQSRAPSLRKTPSSTTRPLFYLLEKSPLVYISRKEPGTQRREVSPRIQVKEGSKSPLFALKTNSSTLPNAGVIVRTVTQDVMTAKMDGGLS
ncbi:hypothetical protein GHT06_021827 [Daphnia sinensis]|uniref:Uncharacterized protein n=1 Tax=Daphnia sinensis TaxID=1820382 RepID=A0AAD5KGG7_9CRUS|nr:hypothetical protein GHT06_021827 [Daphnia sinensis]